MLSSVFPWAYFFKGFSPRVCTDIPLLCTFHFWLSILRCILNSPCRTAESLRNWRHLVQFSLVAQLCPTLCDLMNCSTPGLPVHHQLPELTQTHVHRVSDAIQPSHPLSSPSLPALSLSQHQGIFQWVSSSHQVARVLEFRLQHQSFQWIFRTDFLQSCFLWVCFLNSKVVLSWMLWFTWQHTRKSLKYCCKYLNATSICI